MLYKLRKTITWSRKHILPLIETFNHQIQVKLGRAEWVSHRALETNTQHFRRTVFIFIQRTQACIVCQPWNIAPNVELMKLDAVNADKSSNNYLKKFKRSIEKGAEWRGRTHCYTIVCGYVRCVCNFKYVLLWKIWIRIHTSITVTPSALSVFIWFEYIKWIRTTGDECGGKDNWISAEKNVHTILLLRQPWRWRGWDFNMLCDYCWWVPLDER